MIIRFTLLLLVTIGTICRAQFTRLGLIAQWNQMEFVFPSPEARQLAMYQRKYIPGNSVPIDVDVDYSEHGHSRLFITMPRFEEGVPITLGVVSTLYGSNSSVVHAYPSYSWQESHGGNCDGITSVFRVFIDECNRLWVLDAGRIGETLLCPPQILVFNLKNDKLVHRVKIPFHLIQQTSILVTPVVNVKDPPPGKCRDTQVYIADVTTFHVLVYDLKSKRTWRTANKYFYPHPAYGTFTLGGDSFDLMDGIVGMALSPKHTVGGQQMLFHPLAASTEMTVPLWVLENRTAWENAGFFDYYEPRAFIELGDRRTQSIAQAFDRFGNLYFGLNDPVSIGCWNLDSPYDLKNIAIVSHDEERLQFATGLKVITNRLGDEELWVLTNRLQKFLTGNLSDREVNFRILAIPTSQLLNSRQRCHGAPVTATFLTYG